MNRPAFGLVIAHLVGNALLLYVGYRWLGMSESDGPHLLASISALLLFVFGALWLHGTALLNSPGYQPLSYDRSRLFASPTYPELLQKTSEDVVLVRPQSCY